VLPYEQLNGLRRGDFPATAVMQAVAAEGLADLRVPAPRLEDRSALIRGCKPLGQELAPAMCGRRAGSVRFRRPLCSTAGAQIKRSQRAGPGFGIAWMSAHLAKDELAAQV